MASRIRKINTGTRNTVQKLILSALGSNDSVRSIAVSKDGAVYAVDTGRHMLLQIFEDGRVRGALDGRVSTAGDNMAQGLSGKDGNTARLNNPAGICVDNSENIYFGDRDGKKVKKATSSGRCIDFLGGTSTGDAVSATGSSVTFAGSGLGLAVNATGTLFICDTGNNKIKMASQNGNTVVLAGGTTGLTGTTNGNGNTARFNAPQDICCDASGNIFVADTGNHRIRKVDLSGNVTTLAGGSQGYTDAQGTSAKLNSPRRICCDRSGFLYFIDHANNAIRRCDQDGTVTTICPYQPISGATGDIDVDASGFLYVLESNT